MCKDNMKNQILVELGDLELRKSALETYIEAVMAPTSHQFMADRVHELNSVQDKIYALQTAYQLDCAVCIGEAYHMTSFFDHHGCCQSCFYDVDSSEEYPELDDSFECSDCKKSFEFSPFASITEGACLCPQCYDNSRYEVRFCLSASYKVFGGYVENVAKFTDEQEAIAFIEKHGDECESISIVRYNCTCKFLHGTCIDMCQYHINDMENR